MRTILKGIGKLFCVLISALLVAALVVGGWFGVQGYNIYQDAVEDMPISEKVDLAICRAVWNDIRTFSLAEGGSTITRQLMKNDYMSIPFISAAGTMGFTMLLKDISERNRQS